MFTKEQQATLFIVAVIFMIVWDDTNWSLGDKRYQVDQE